MGSEYTLLVVDDENAIVDVSRELVINEMSNKLDIAIYKTVDGEMENSEALRDLTPDQVRDVALKMLQTASYWVADSEEFLDSAVKSIKEGL